MSSLGGIFNNGVSGLLAFTQAMGAVTDNIANLTTVGYKRVETSFSSLLGEHDVPGRVSGPLANSNINGVTASTHQLIGTQGTIQTTNRSLDVAINGQGLYAFTDDPTNTSGNIFYGRAGNFQMVIPPGGGTSAYLANERGQFLLAAPLANGVATIPTSTSGLVPVQVTQTAFAGQQTSVGTLTAVVPAAGATTATAPFNYVDTAGVPQTMSLTFTNPVIVSGVSTSWTVTATDANGGAGGTGTITFDPFGQATAGTTLAITATSTNFTGTAPVTSFSLDMTDVAMLGDASSTSNGSALVQVVDYVQDGLPAGNFEQLSIGPDGIITNRYSGGATSAVYQIPLAVFQSVNSLEARSGDVFVETQNSGAPSFVFPGTTFATLKSGAVETSNVDIADSFSQMIITQRAYQTAAQVIKVADEMTTTATNLKR
jgi:flagellar hook protein FlgE